MASSTLHLLPANRAFFKTLGSSIADLNGAVFTQKDDFLQNRLTQTGEIRKNRLTQKDEAEVLHEINAQLLSLLPDTSTPEGT